MYIFGYFFQKGHFKGSSEKRAHRQKTLGRLTTPLPPRPLAPEGLLQLRLTKLQGLLIAMVTKDKTLDISSSFDRV